MKMTIEEINAVIGVMTDLFPWANKKQIKDPNLIYPNQVFVVPARAGK